MYIYIDYNCHICIALCSVYEMFMVILHVILLCFVNVTALVYHIVEHTCSLPALRFYELKDVDM